MGVLANPKHERFAQELAKGKTGADAYEIAGYTPNPKNGDRLKGNEGIRSRVAEIQSKAAEKAGITVERILAEMAKIGFSDIRKAVDWRGDLVREQDNPDGGDVLVIKEIFSNHVRLIDSDRIDDDTAAAISEVRQSTTGGVSIKFYDKQSALMNMGKHLGMFPDKIDHSGSLTLKQEDALADLK